MEVVSQLLGRRLPKTIKKAKNLVEMELAYINTKHPDFHKEQIVETLVKQEVENQHNVGGDAERFPPQQQLQRHMLSPLEQREGEVTQKLIKAYLKIIRKSIQDNVPKAIMRFMVNFVKDNLQSELMTHLYRQEQFDNLLQESEHIAIRRRDASEMLKVIDFLLNSFSFLFLF